MLYIASYKQFKTSPYPSHQEAAIALFKLCRKANRCSTARATEIDGLQKSLEGGFDMRSYDRYSFSAKELGE